MLWTRECIVCTRVKWYGFASGFGYTVYTGILVYSGGPLLVPVLFRLFFFWFPFPYMGKL